MPPSHPAEHRLDEELLRRWALPEDAGEDKRSRGTVVVIGGSTATPGSVLLAGVAALRAGAGRLQIVTDGSVAAAVAIAVPESMVVPFDHPGIADLLAAADAILVGPGLSDDGLAEHLVDLAYEFGVGAAPLVVDALALRSVHARRSAPNGVVLTPNREELETLGGGRDPSDVAIKLDATIALFGSVFAPDGSRFVDSDADVARGLGTSGSGDVLAGIVAGLAARCGDVVQAAIWASWLHRQAGNRLAERVGPVGYLARELADEVAPTMAGLLTRVSPPPQSTPKGDASSVGGADATAHVDAAAQ